MPNSECPKCGKKLDGATGLNGATVPRKDDWSVCIYCGLPLVFDEMLRLVVPTERALAQMMHHPQIAAAVMLIKQDAHHVRD
jgi:hypothetical protein